MELSPSWKAESISTRPEILFIRNSNFHCISCSQLRHRILSWAGLICSPIYTKCSIFQVLRPQCTYAFYTSRASRNTRQFQFYDSRSPHMLNWEDIRILIVLPLVSQQPLLGQGLLIIESSRSYTDTPHSVGFLWASDQPDAETSSWQHKVHTGQTCMAPAGFKPAIPANERSQTHALDRAATGLGVVLV
jgi:hypothetical protein